MVFGLTVGKNKLRLSLIAGSVHQGAELEGQIFLIYYMLSVASVVIFTARGLLYR